MKKPVVLYTTPVLLHPPIGGPYLRIENSIKALFTISDLFIYCRANQDTIGGLAALSFYQQYCKKIFFDPIDDTSEKILQFTSQIFPFLTQHPYKQLIAKLELKENFRFLQKIADRTQPDLIWLGYGNISYPLLKYLKQFTPYKVVVDSDSVWSQYILRRLPFVGNPKDRNKIEEEGRSKAEEERWGTRLADVTTAVSELDAEYYRTLAKNPDQVKIFSNVIDLDNYQQISLPPRGYTKPCLYLAGSFFPGSPMEDAARWIISQILPLVWKQKPNVHMYIIGNKSDKFLSDVKDPRITITGRLLSVLPYLCNSNIALVPLRFESGTRFKILEAGACKIPVISTSLGAEGLLVSHNKDILLADDPAQFAASIIKLLNDKNFADELAQNLYHLIKEKYSISSLIQEGALILEYINRCAYSKL